MATKKPRRQIRKPTSILFKPMKADFKGLFVSLTKAIAAGVTLQWDKAAGEATAAITSIGFENDPEGLAWVLVRRAMTQSLFDLVSQSADLLSEARIDTKRLLPDQLAEELDEKMESLESKLDSTLFSHPEQLSIVDAMRKSLARWTEAWGVAKEKSESLAGRLPAYFLFHLSNEWRLRAREYTPLREALNTPFTPAEERQQQWACYSAFLQRMVDQSMLGEPFSLRQLYPPPWRERFKLAANRLAGDCGGGLF